MSKIAPIFNCFDVFTPKVQNVKAKKNSTKTIAPEMVMHSRFPKVKDKVILASLVELSNVKFYYDDVNYLNSLGAKLSFSSGHDVVDFLSEKKVNIKFDKTSVKGVFAQYNYIENAIIVNDDYKNTKNKADILAISEAILHEAGHAKDNDYNNSVQEEINNLALNVLAHKYYSNTYPDIFDSSESSIVKDGVNAYASLFYDKDPEKKALIERLKQKYGYLPSYDVLHPVSALAQKVNSDKN